MHFLPNNIKDLSFESHCASRKGLLTHEMIWLCCWFVERLLLCSACCTQGRRSASVKLAVKYMKRVSAEKKSIVGHPEEEELIIQAVRLVFRVHQVMVLELL